MIPRELEQTIEAMIAAGFRFVDGEWQRPDWEKDDPQA